MYFRFFSFSCFEKKNKTNPTLRQVINSRKDTNDKSHIPTKRCLCCTGVCPCSLCSLVGTHGALCRFGTSIMSTMEFSACLNFNFQGSILHNKLRFAFQIKFIIDWAVRANLDSCLPCSPSYCMRSSLKVQASYACSARQPSESPENDPEGFISSNGISTQFYSIMLKQVLHLPFRAESMPNRFHRQGALRAWISFLL